MGRPQSAKPYFSSLLESPLVGNRADPFRAWEVLGGKGIGSEHRYGGRCSIANGDEDKRSSIPAARSLIWSRSVEKLRTATNTMI